MVNPTSDYVYKYAPNTQEVDTDTDNRSSIDDVQELGETVIRVRPVWDQRSDPGIQYARCRISSLLWGAIYCMLPAIIGCVIVLATGSAAATVAVTLTLSAVAYGTFVFHVYLPVKAAGLHFWELSQVRMDALFSQSEWQCPSLHGSTVGEVAALGQSLTDLGKRLQSVQDVLPAGVFGEDVEGPDGDVLMKTAGSGGTDLQQRMATIVLISLMKMDYLVSDVAQWYPEFVAIVTELAKEHSGVVFSVGSGNIMISWNAHLPHPEHQYWACLCALSLRDALQKSKRRSQLCQRFDLEWSIAVASGMVLFGTVAGYGMTSPVLMGPTTRFTHRLAELGYLMKSPIMITQPVYEAVQDKLGALMVDYCLQLDECSTPIRIGIYELVEKLPCETDNVIEGVSGEGTSLSDFDVTLYKTGVGQFGTNKHDKATMKLLLFLKHCSKLTEKLHMDYRYQYHASRLLRLSWQMSHMTEEEKKKGGENGEKPKKHLYYRQDGWQKLEAQAQKSSATTPLPKKWAALLATVNESNMADSVCLSARTALSPALSKGSLAHLEGNNFGQEVAFEDDDAWENESNASDASNNSRWSMRSSSSVASLLSELDVVRERVLAKPGGGLAAPSSGTHSRTPVSARRTVANRGSLREEPTTSPLRPQSARRLMSHRLSFSQGPQNTDRSDAEGEWRVGAMDNILENASETSLADLTSPGGSPMNAGSPLPEDRFIQRKANSLSVHREQRNSRLSTASSPMSNFGLGAFNNPFNNSSSPRLDRISRNGSIAQSVVSQQSGNRSDTTESPGLQGKLNLDDMARFKCEAMAVEVQEEDEDPFLTRDSSMGMTPEAGSGSTVKMATTPVSKPVIAAPMVGIETCDSTDPFLTRDEELPAKAPSTNQSSKSLSGLMGQNPVGIETCESTDPFLTRDDEMEEKQGSSKEGSVHHSGPNPVSSRSRGSSLGKANLPPRAPASVSQSPRKMSTSNAQASPAEDQAEQMSVYRDISGTTVWRQSRTVLGKGAFASVYLGMNDKGKLMAMKEMKLSDSNLKTEKAVDKLLQELKVLINCRHDNIVCYHGVALLPQDNEVPPTSLVVIMEYVPCGSLQAICEKFGALPSNTCRMYVRDVLRGLKYLHDKDIVHRDIKPGNILLEKEGQCKLADFGTAGFLPRDDKVEGDYNHAVGDKGLTGSPLFMGPECIREGVRLASDIWSVGITTLMLLQNDTCWGDVRLGPTGDFLHPVALVHRIADEDVRPTIPEGLPMEVKDFLNMCIVRNPVERASASELLSEAGWLL